VTEVGLTESMLFQLWSSHRQYISETWRPLSVKVVLYIILNCAMR